MLADYISHHIRLFGLSKAGTDSNSQPLVTMFDRAETPGGIESICHRGKVVVAQLADTECLATFGGSAQHVHSSSPTVFHQNNREEVAPLRLRTLHDYFRLDLPDAEPVLVDETGASVWLWKAIGRGGVLFVGTDIAGDLRRYRQGDPARLSARTDAEMYGFAGERPIYLFEEQIEAERPAERYADWWAEALASTIAVRAGLKRRNMLPHGAPGAVVFTGDDDQAQLANYVAQREAIGQTPITYFLHPLTKHDDGTLVDLMNAGPTELGIHPDALDQPEEYDRLFDEQMEWYGGLTGTPAKLVRNHGFLNDGYWGHAVPWLKHGITGSSNIPGLDGRVLNGSLLPAKLLLDGKIENHWSVLTAIGDGVVFALKWDDAQCVACVQNLANDIRESGVPGIIVLNMHPDNIAHTRALHSAALDVIDSGFHAWTLGDCLQWFSDLDQGAPDPTRKRSSLRERFKCWIEAKSGS